MPMKFKLLVASMAIVAWSGTAQAGRTVIDSVDGVTIPKTIGGYCDLDQIASECTPQSLGYEVNFGTGFQDGVIVYGNGLISFGQVALGPQPVFGNVSDVADLSDTLTGYDGVVVSGGLNNNEGFDQDFNSRMLYIGSVSVLSGGVISALFNDCISTLNCNTANTTLTLTPTEGGFSAAFTNLSGNLAGYSIPGGSSSALIATQGTFFIPAEFRGLNLVANVPEPGTWATMLLGFGAMGTALRRRRRKPQIVLPAA